MTLISKPIKRRIRFLSTSLAPSASAGRAGSPNSRRNKQRLFGLAAFLFHDLAPRRSATTNQKTGAGKAFHLAESAASRMTTVDYDFRLIV